MCVVCALVHCLCVFFCVLVGVVCLCCFVICFFVCLFILDLAAWHVVFVVRFCVGLLSVCLF